jgi:hypothetical protein
LSCTLNNSLICLKVYSSGPPISKTKLPLILPIIYGMLSRIIVAVEPLSPTYLNLISPSPAASKSVVVSLPMVIGFKELP